MREPNLCFPSQNRAAVCITSGIYDRRALDCTATLPLINSLTNLAYLTSTTPRIREILCLDGGLEKLVRILEQTANRKDRLTLWKWSLAFQNIVNIGVRGTESIRTKVVEAGVIPYVLSILSNFITKPSASEQSSISTSNTTTNDNDAKSLRRSTFPYVKINSTQRRSKRMQRNNKNNPLDIVFHREEDVLLCLQLLAYLSKYAHIRELFHTEYQKNVFSVVETFCHRFSPAQIQYWAGVIMRNACRKDEARGGIRQCANMSCGKWESQPREFAKCRRCRKAKYCSKACQSQAWADGHRWWCIERHSSMNRDNTNTAASINTLLPTTNNTTATNESSSNDNTSNDQSVILNTMSVRMEL